MNMQRLAGAAALLMFGSIPAYAESNFDMSAGYRRDSLQWSIAGTINGTSPNVLSELTWDNLNIAQLGIRWHQTNPQGFHTRFSAAYGAILSGDNQDSDYSGNNRTGEFSRSNNNSDGDSVIDLSGAIGFRLRSGTVDVTPLLGYSFHGQYLRMTDGYQTIPATGSFSGLNSTYDAEWDGFWFGAEIETVFGSGIRAYLRLEHHIADYYAEANWNLRNDFRHPKSFEHIADGSGTVLSFGVGSDPKPGKMGLNVNVDYQNWNTDAGVDRVFFSNGTTSSTRLNEVTWKSFAVSLSARFVF